MNPELWNGSGWYNQADIMGIPHWQWDLGNFLNEYWILIPFIAIGFGLGIMIGYDILKDYIKKLELR